MFSRFPFERVNWLVSSFLIGTLFLSLTAVPLYLYLFGIDCFQIALFFVMFFACGFSITLGYHRLFSHLAFRAHWLVRFFTVIFGAGAFENSVLLWASEHRTHFLHQFALPLSWQATVFLQMQRPGLVAYGNRYLGRRLP